METNYFKIVRMLMILTGIWRLELNSKYKMLEKIYTAYSVFIQIYYIVFISTFVIGLPGAFQAGDRSRAMEGMAMSILCVVQILKMILTQSKGLVDLLKSVLEDEEQLNVTKIEEDKKIYLQSVAYVRRVSLILTLYTYIFVGVPIIMVKYIMYLQMNKEGLFQNGTVDKPMPYVAWFPFDANKYYAVAFSYHIAGCCIGCTYNIITQLFFCTMMCFVISKLGILKNHFSNFHLYVDEVNPKEEIYSDAAVLTALKRFIQEHTGLIQWVFQLDESMKTLMLLEFSIISLQVASLLLQLLSVKPNTNTVYTVFFLGLTIYQIYLLSWHANEIKEHSLGLDLALYDSKWYELSPAVKRCILIMMIRSQRPLLLNIGPFYPMTTSTAVSTLKAAYSYVALLRTV